MAMRLNVKLGLGLRRSEEHWRSYPCAYTYFLSHAIMSRVSFVTEGGRKPRTIWRGKADLKGVKIETANAMRVFTIESWSRKPKQFA